MRIRALIVTGFMLFSSVLCVSCEEKPKITWHDEVYYENNDREFFLDGDIDSIHTGDTMYSWLIAASNIPKDFVNYEDICIYFGSFVSCSDYLFNWYNDYLYEFENTQTTYCLRVFSEGYNFIEEERLGLTDNQGVGLPVGRGVPLTEEYLRKWDNVMPKYMNTLPENKNGYQGINAVLETKDHIDLTAYPDNKATGYMYLDGITYAYARGKLIYVGWESDGTGFELRGTIDDSENIIFPDTDFVNHLLCADTAKEAVEEFTENLISSRKAG